MHHTRYYTPQLQAEGVEAALHCNSRCCASARQRTLRRTVSAAVKQGKRLFLMPNRQPESRDAQSVCVKAEVVHAVQTGRPVR